MKGDNMTSELKEVTTCEGCLFFWSEIFRKIGKVYHCNYYPNLKWALTFSPQNNKHPDCKITNIVINMD
jgi:hypothetical protein